MNKGMLLGIVWAVLIFGTAWYVFKNYRPGILK